MQQRFRGGGEFLLADCSDFRRLATVRAMPLVGGERAIRESWRVALAVLDDAFDGAPPLDRLPLFAQLSSRDVLNVRQLLRTGFQVVPAHGVGRVFDAAAAILLSRPRAHFEAQLAMALEQTAEGQASPWPFELTRSAPWQLDLRPMWRALVAELLEDVPVPLLAGPRPVVLSGGCFANARLVTEVLHGLEGVEVHLPRRVPPGDGGLALGQAVIAAAQLEGVH